jgi:hypothetical protein
MKSKQLAGYLFSALMLTCFQQAAAQTTYNGSVAKSQGMKADHMGMAPKCDEQGVVDVWADFLWWTTNFNMPPGLATELATIVPNLNNTTNDLRIKIDRPDNRWDPGVRVGIGWNTGYDNWDVQGYWTFFYNSKTKHHTPLDLDVVGQPTSGIELGKVKQRFRYNAADVELGKAYYVSSHFYIRPFTGIHAIWTSQVDDERYNSNGTFLNNAFNGTKEYEFRSDMGSWGVGPRIGFNSNWGNFRGLSLMGNISGSLVYGQFQFKQKMEVEPSTTTEYTINLRDKQYWQLMPTMQILMGLSYSCCFGNGQYQFRASAGWETNFIWQASNFWYVERPISMQGLTAEIRFDF